MKIATTKYDAQRALNELEAAREAGDWATDTQLFGPKLLTQCDDDTVPMLPALMRPQV